eukprot:TRINITY_DN740_c0_g1_i1.p1 TRINITY_DN740_c0_g1~~TRINITY_DN740_c0_g1_i1.p1  ORF type:complete len:151 (+),score=68.30 TRINITY_DN740_c0_g1_i1:202-654(+)
MGALSLGENKEASESDAKSQGKAAKSKKKQAEGSVVISKAARNKKKAITNVVGLDLFGVKLKDAAKLFGKKFACGASVVAVTEEAQGIAIQGDIESDVADFILQQFREVPRNKIYFQEKNKKVKVFPDDDDDEEDEEEVLDDAQAIIDSL